MTFPTSQTDPGSHRSAGVTDDLEMRVIVTPYPPLVEQKVRPFRQYLTVDGASDGSNDMGVDGSLSNVDFYIKSHPEDDRYITSLNFIVGYGATSRPYLFADAAALTNGVRLFYKNSTGEHDIHEGIKSNQDLFRLSFSQIPAIWEVRHVNANNDYGYFISMDLRRMGLPFGIKLDRTTTQKLILRIRDDCTNADSFDCIAYGFDRFK